jgi:hypothetical protein
LGREDKLRKKCLFALFGFRFWKTRRLGWPPGRASRGATDSGIAIEPVMALSI